MTKDILEDKIGSVLAEFRAKCSSCMWNKEIDTNENCRTCTTDNTKYILSLFKIEKLDVGGANADIPSNWKLAMKVNEIIDIINKGVIYD